ncbi:SMC-Scp complex subunit ScpB [Candidatus Woesearchaeota archaeon]|nr:MAG: SMC-Scp complex subunit ScpB [Candidatus Woesearchaeota archaeon]
MIGEAGKKVEALLFAVGKKISIDEIMRICDLSHEETRKALEELKKDYDERESPLMIVQEGKDWKLTVREKYLDIVHKVVADVELRKSVTETLAVIAWKSPVLQSEVIKVRTNKAYEDIKELEDAGFITKTKKGRSFLLKVTDKFYEYFDVKGKDDIKKMFEQVEDKAKESEEHEKLGDLEVYDEPLAEKEVHETGKLPEQNIEVVDIPEKTGEESKEKLAEEVHQAKKENSEHEGTENKGESEEISKEEKETQEEASQGKKESEEELEPKEDHEPEETGEKESSNDLEEEKDEEPEEDKKEDPLKEDEELRQEVDETAELLGIEK